MSKFRRLGNAEEYCQAEGNVSLTDFEIIVKGRVVTVPSLVWIGCRIIICGKRLKLAKIHDEEWLDRELENPAACLLKLRSLQQYGFSADIFTFSQMVPECKPKYSYGFEWESIAAVCLNDYASWWSNLSQETRKNSRRATRRGVTVQIESLTDELIRNIVEVNNESPIRQGRPFAHYGKTFEQVKKDQATFADRSEFICAYLEGELIGFAKVVHRGKVSAILQLVTKSSHYDKRPANAILVQAVQHCSQKGMSHLIYGKYRYGNKSKSSLLEFKVRHGFEEILVPKYFIPLTQRGRLALALKVHRGLIDILPEWLITAGVSARAKWYKGRAMIAGVAQR